MANSGLMGVRSPTEDVELLQETLGWAQDIRRSPNHTTTALQLADTVIEQTQQLLAIAQEQLDRCNVEPLPQAHRVSA